MRRACSQRVHLPNLLFCRIGQLFSLRCLAALLEDSRSRRTIAARLMQETASQMRQKIVRELQGKVVEILDEELAGHSKGFAEGHGTKIKFCMCLMHSHAWFDLWFWEASLLRRRTVLMERIQQFFGKHPNLVMDPCS